MLSHDIELAVSLDPPSLRGSGSVRVRATEPAAVVVLDATKLAVSRLLQEAQPLRFEQHPRSCV